MQRAIWFCSFSALVIGSFLAGATAWAGVWYVDDDAPGGDGTTWESAFNDLQEALVAAQAGDQIWVAAGTYRPSELEDPEEPRSATFQLLSGVAIYGGLAGDEDPETFDLAARDLAANETILSGDLAANDTDLFDPWHPTLAENCFHVVTGSGTDSTAVVDGVTITAGHAKGPEATDVHRPRGGGVYVHWGEPTLINITFRNNMARCGGGLAQMNSANGSTLLNCTFKDNWTRSYGGGICCTEADITVVDCTFSGNMSDSYGGGITIRGGASGTFTNCAFRGNSAVDNGGGVNVLHGYPTLISCTLSGNSAESGGGLRNIGGSPRLVNCTFSANSADYGNGLHNDNGTVTLTGCILWDAGEEIYNTGFWTTAITFSDVQGGWPGQGNIDVDPLFVDADGADDIPGTADDDLHLLPDSPCVNGGSNYPPRLPGEDYEGQPRVQNCRADMGVDESPYAPGTLTDCNENSQPDDCDIYSGTSQDCNQNHVPDECEPDQDCNNNSVQDICDIAAGTSQDCNQNMVPDECDLTGGTSDDVNGNGVPDECECICGDVDRGGGPIDMNDFASFANCYGLAVPTPDCVAATLICCDLDANDLVDLTDFATFALLYGLTSTNVPPECIPE